MSKTPFQSFRLDLANVARCLELIQGGVNTRRDIAKHMGMGEKKIEGIFEWAEFLGLLEDRPRPGVQVLTGLARSLVELPAFARSLPVLEILYGLLARNHPLVNSLVQDFAYSVSQQFDPCFDLPAYKRALLSGAQGLDVKPEFLLKRARVYLDALVNPRSLGRLGVLVPIGGDRVRVNSHRPDWRAAGYLLYSIWPRNTARMGIAEVVAGRDGLGRVFFLSESQVMGTLAKLEQERAIALEMVADLRQIGPNPSMEAEDFLEMLLHEQD